MADCEMLATCAFFKQYENDPSRKLALSGLARLYCHGEKQSECVRKKVRQQLGAEKVPVNMLPNGRPLDGSDDSNWPSDVKALAFARS